jgi:hypothetical protein
MFDLQTYTLIHVLISLVALFTGLPLLLAFAAGRTRPGLASLTIVLLVLTSATGFGFPFLKFLPSHAVGVLSTLVLAVTIYARWSRQLAGAWRTAYGLTLAVAVYLDAFVALVQAFLKIPALNALAPTQQSPGFIIGHSLLLIAFIALGIASLRGLRRVA